MSEPSNIITRTCTISYNAEIGEHPDLVLRIHIRKLIKDYEGLFEYPSYLQRILIDETTPKMPSYGEVSQEKEKP